MFVEQWKRSLYVYIDDMNKYSRFANGFPSRTLYSDLLCYRKKEL